MRKLLLIPLLLSLAMPSFGQFWSSTARRITSGTAVPPAACYAGPVDVYVRTGATSPGLYLCLSQNTWTGPLSQGGGGNVSNNVANTFTAAGTLDLSGSTVPNAFLVPVLPGATATTNGALDYDSTNNNLHARRASADAVVPTTTVTPVNGNCTTWSVVSGSFRLGDTGSPCGGSPGGGIVGYSATSVTLTAGTRYFPIVGGGSPSTTETDVDTEAPSAATITNFYASVSVALGAGNSAVFTYRDNAVGQSLTCTISGASATTCNDSTHSFNKVKGDLLIIQVVKSGTIVVTPTLVMTAQFGTTGSNGTVNSGTINRPAYYAATGTAVSDPGAGYLFNGAGEFDIGGVGVASGILGLLGTTNGTASFTAPASASTRTNPVISSNALQIGAAGTAGGVLLLGGSTSGTANFTAPAVAGTSTNGVTMTNVLLGPDGSTSAPTYSWTSSPNSGLTANGSAAALIAGGSIAFQGGAATNVTRHPICENNGTSCLTWASGLISTTGAGTPVIHGNNTLQLISDFNTAANTSLQTITGLSYTFPASTALKLSFQCPLNYSQATATAAVAFGVQGATTAPNSIDAHGVEYTSATAFSFLSLNGLNTTTATNIVSATPSAITTVWGAELDGTVDVPSNASPTVLNFMVSTATSGDAVTVKRGSYCQLF